FWTGFFVLEGFDFGVGALHSVVGRSEIERRVAINSVGPFWDGNEVWLVVGAAAIFAAFPAWYATWISASYLAIVLVLVALIVRGISFEWRGHGRGDRWRGGWSLCLTLGSIVAPTILALALGDLLAGLPIDSDGDFTGDFLSLFTGFGVWT
ncbi:cytochrome d ubiquinol oxidase subunit II, partial [Paenibacillus sp. TAF58]